jgi:hypothetical protein
MSDLLTELLRAESEEDMHPAMCFQLSTPRAIGSIGKRRKSSTSDVAFVFYELDVK